jgi:hypothetical protein
MRLLPKSISLKEGVFQISVRREERKRDPIGEMEEAIQLKSKGGWGAQKPKIVLQGLATK